MQFTHEQRQASRVYELTILGIVGGLMFGTACFNLLNSEDDRAGLFEISKTFFEMVDNANKTIPLPISFATAGGLFSYGYAKITNFIENCCCPIIENKMG